MVNEWIFNYEFDTDLGQCRVKGQLKNSTLTLACFAVTYKTRLAGTKIGAKSVLAVCIDITDRWGLQALVIIYWYKTGNICVLFLSPSCAKCSTWTIFFLQLANDAYTWQSYLIFILEFCYRTRILACTCAQLHLDSETEGRKKTDYHTFSSHIKPQFICHKIIRSFFLGVTVKLAHFARNEKIVTCTPGVSFTGVLAINNSPHWKLFESVSLKCFTRY